MVGAHHLQVDQYGLAVIFAIDEGDATFRAAGMSSETTEITWGQQFELLVFRNNEKIILFPRNKKQRG